MRRVASTSRFLEIKRERGGGEVSFTEKQLTAHAQRSACRGVSVEADWKVENTCQSNENVSADLLRTATGQGNVLIQLLTMDCARNATKRRELQKQILWAARQLLRGATP
jgi:hypothetical protein